MKIVYGLMTNTGNGNEFLYDLGVWETEESANDYLVNKLPHSTGIWVEQIEINDPSPEDLMPLTEKMLECSQCGVSYSPEDIHIIDGVDVCLDCEPAFKQNKIG
ncbi:hypothetical protein D1B31_14695 [Neobacillus notoginsengisoli]|uniref:Uncharacterized protein n=1 Tax=Neobacillus notoginsengisoli TaxID=1578198 RepID=A0A417YRV3_9BACI|nr:hypothetical protein [Neobacillus notoginsengisoli]RHW38028.1 hypothetical protein D1B31_14695 [Neobacillus notoginsengisoli]